MDRRTLLAAAGASLSATLAGCVGGRGPPEEEYPECLQMDDTDSEERFLETNEPPETPGAGEFLAVVEEETGGLYWFTDDGTERIGFSEAGDTWELMYDVELAGAREQTLAEITAVATGFASHRPAGVSLYAEGYHECFTASWHVCADTADAYERGEIDRETFLDTVHETLEVVTPC